MAVATKMVALVFLSLGGALPFLKSNRLPQKPLRLLIILTVAGSLLGVWGYGTKAEATTLLGLN